MKQKKKQSKVGRFEILNGRSVDYCQVAILKGVAKVSLIKVRFERAFEKLGKLAKQMSEGRAFLGEQHPEQRSQGESEPDVPMEKQGANVALWGSGSREEVQRKRSER